MLLNKMKMLVTSAFITSVSIVCISPAYAVNPASEPVANNASTAATLVSDDDRFMALRNAAFHVDSNVAKMHASQLTDFDIPSYVDYYVLRTQMHTSSTEQMLQFLKKYQGSAIADRLRNDWLLVLAWRGDWTNFDQQLPLYVVNDDTQVKCYALLSKAIKKQKVVNEMRELITSSKDYGDGCYALVDYLYEKRQINADDLWTQMRLASESSATSLAKRLGKMLNVPEKRLLEAMDKPSRILKKKPASDQLSKELFLMSIGRQSKISPETAIDALKKYGNRLNKADKAQAWANIALPASQKLQAEAIDYWDAASGASLSEEAYQWRARMALRAGDWKMLKAAISVMPDALRNDETWVYWYGRCLLEEGKKDEAQKMFVRIADQHHFYGQLALEETGNKIGVPILAKPVTAIELAPIVKNPDLLRAIRFYDIGLRFEGTREWNWALRKFNEREHLIAAEFARQNNLLDRMVNTSDRTKEELDFSQRFPTPFNDKMYKATQTLGLDMAWVYGLIRQESRFIMNAKSHVGASGLMQIMPKTARYVAKKIGLSNFVPEQVNEIETNITLGTNYLNMVLTDLGGSQALASAAYNAGPGRSRSWRASLTRPVEGAIFAETIPFSETRGYVKNVLSNATYYAALIEKKPQSLKARLGMVVPKGMSVEDDADLP
jgi:soluble lytic murein transglycosylase